MSRESRRKISGEAKQPPEKATAATIGCPTSSEQDNAAYHCTLGNALRAQGKIDDAVARYEHALTLKPDYADAHNNLGAALSAQGKSVDAITHFERAIALDPSHVNAHNNLAVALAAQGRLADAMALYERVLALSPNHANVHNNYGIALAAQGRVADAIAHYERALALDPCHADAHNNMGIVLAGQGRFADAVTHYECAITQNPGHVNAINNLGVALGAQGKIADAMARFEHALALNPGLADAHHNLGLALMAQGRVADAVIRYESAVALNPSHAAAHNSLGIALAAQGRVTDAMIHYGRAVALNPGFASAQNNIGLALMAQGRLADAVSHYEQVLAVSPGHGHAHNNLGLALAAQGRVADAMTHYERALAINPCHADAHNNLGIALAGKGRTAEATAHYEQALAVGAGHVEAYNNLANVFKEDGKFDEAVALYDRAIAMRPDYREAHFNRAEIKSFHAGDADLAAMETLASRDALSGNTDLYLHFALGKALDDMGDYLGAFEHLSRGNALKRRQIEYDETGIVRLFQRISAVFDRSLFERFQGAGDPSPVPVFVLGMPRSGSSLVEQILASHPQIYGAGELKDLEIIAGSGVGADGRKVDYPDYVPGLDGAGLRRIGEAYLARLPVLAEGKTRIVDKLPGNFFHIGLIRLILPNAKIIHTMRDAADTCVSCYSRLFAAGLYFSYDLGELGRFYRHYSELMSHWRSVLPAGGMLEVAYEDVVDDIEGQARRMIEYCGLPWDAACIRFHENLRPVKTASAFQVRKPLFRSSLQRWRKYENWIGPLLDELGSDRR